jgi:molybdopterin/thiamine biosynthesis adenylyltransferase
LRSAVSFLRSLRAASVSIVGVGVSDALAKIRQARVVLHCVDFDRVEDSNLTR